MLFYQPQDGYCFNSDSIFLYDFAASFSPKGRVLDVGSGVGVIGLLLARDFPIELTMIEKQEKMASLAEKNLETNKITANLLRSDFLEYQGGEPFDFIVSNPPFYHGDVVQSRNSHINACRYNTHLPIEPFFKKVASLLLPRGHFIFCYDASQLPELLVTLEKVALRAEDIRFVHPKADRPAKLVMIHARRGSRSKSRVLPPFIVFEGDRYMPEAQEIFKRAGTHTIKCQI
ncbi:tRNA1(Val) (adenine(37)-N6)-methyltransferase [Hydrogenimonas cancrithermarum]|uniref:Methyltransferase n=1 Tax=Hydrogenimonas cancrithermarum TaxID=2993563 RepID=A0ABM8FIB3_9BACT|nr:methyltransferase [Hydrogenimonas cancrithermarum]BDY12015.1 methyltransferase [Hydrogenimonas cancrithermarum]